MEIKAIRAELRARFINDPFLMALFGFRVPRKPRAETRRELRKPTTSERRQARKMGARNTAHEIEQFFNRRGIRMTRNMQSQDRGARP
jgi:hypothetical protein